MASGPKKVVPMTAPMAPVALAPKVAPVVVAPVPAPIVETVADAPTKAAAQIEKAAAEAPVKAVANIEKTAAVMPAAAAEMQAKVRQAFEKQVADAKAAYVRVKATADEATGAIETTVTTATKGIVALNGKTLEALRANAEANFEFVKQLIGATTVSQIVTLQSEHVRKQAETVSAQAKDIGALAQKVANESLEPIKAQLARSMKLAS